MSSHWPAAPPPPIPLARPSSVGLPPGAAPGPRGPAVSPTPSPRSRHAGGPAAAPDTTLSPLAQALTAAVACAEANPRPLSATEHALLQQLCAALRPPDGEADGATECRTPIPPAGRSDGSPRRPRPPRPSAAPPTDGADLLRRLQAWLRRLAAEGLAAALPDAAALAAADHGRLLQVAGDGGTATDWATGATVPLRGLAQTTVATASAVVCPNTAADPRYRPETDGPGLRAALCVPIVVPGGPAAVLCVGRRDPAAAAFTLLDVQLMETVSLVLGLALSAEGSGPRPALPPADPGALHATARLAQCHSQAALDHALLDGGPALSGAAAAALFHVDHRFNCLVHAWTQQTFPLQRGIVGYVAASQQAVNLAAADVARLYDAEVDNTFGVPVVSVLCVPILTTGKTAAVLQLVNKQAPGGRPLGFTAEDERAVGTLAKHAGFALRRLRDGAPAMGLRREQAVLQCLRGLPAATSLEAFAAKAAKDVRQLANADGAAVFAINVDGMEVDGFYEGNEEGRLADRALVGRVVETGKVINLTDYTFPGVRGRAHCALLLMPVVHGERVVAVLQALNIVTDQRFGPAEEELLLLYARCVARSLADVQALMHSGLECKKLAVMLDVAKKLCMTEMEQYTEVIRSVMEKARELTHADRCSIFLVDHAKGLLEGHLLQAGGREVSVVSLPLRKTSVGFACHVALTGETVCVANAYEHPNFDPSVDELTGYRTRSVLCMPVRVGVEVVAVLQVVNKMGLEPHTWPPFKPEDEAVLATFVPYAGMILRNARLFRELRRKQQTIHTLEELSFALVCDWPDPDQLQAKAVEYARELTGADRCSLFLVDRQAQQLQGTLQGKAITIPMASGIAGWVATTGQTLNIPDAYADPRFNASVDAQTGYRTRSLLCMPVLFRGEVVAVVQLVNKKDGFTTSDEEVFQMFAQWVGVSLRNGAVIKELRAEQRKADLIRLALRNLFLDVRRGWAEVLERISEGAKTLLHAERVTVFTVDHARGQLVSTMADKTAGHQIRIKKSQGIAGMVASSGKPLNIHDAYSDQRFDAEVDKVLGFRTKCLLTHPVLHDGEVIAVLQLLNKTDGTTHFTGEDEELLSYYAFFAGLALTNVRLYGAVAAAKGPGTGRRADERPERRPSALEGPPPATPATKAFSLLTEEELAEEVDAYLEAAEEVTAAELAAVKTGLFDVHEYRQDRAAYLPRVVRLLLELFRDLDLVATFHLDERLLIGFFIQVSQMYRDVPYHNFYHAFDVAQTTYLMIKSCQGAEMLQPFDWFVLMVTALLHDVDHMGLNNNFHLKVSTPMGSLAAVSGVNSVLELHHCSLATTLLSHDSFNIFRTLDQRDRARAYQLLVECILATDMSKQWDVHAAARKIRGQPPPPSGTAERDAYQSVLLKMLIISADVSNIAKPFEVARQWAIAVTDEFHMQGDAEKTEGLEVAAMFDRNKQGELALGQIGFINAIGMKHYEELVALCPTLQWMVDNVRANLGSWTALLR